MSGSLNKVLLIGNLGADPELSYTPSGTAKAVVRLATNEVWNNADGQKQVRTEWHRVVFWGRRAEIIGEYLTKGRQIFVEGRLQTRSWESNEGRRWITEIIGTNVQFLGSNGKKGTDIPQVAEDEPDLPVEDDDIPF
jgi:single-strand DNA-binding protein